MSRSVRKAKIFGITTAETEKRIKEIGIESLEK